MANHVAPKRFRAKKNPQQLRRELHRWFKRAEAVGIAPMPARRPTKGQRLAWEESIVPPATPEQSSGSNVSSHPTISNNIISLRIIVRGS